MAKDEDSVRSDVAERDEEALRRVRAMDAPTAHAVEEQLDGTDTVDGLELPGAFIDEELVVHIVPPAADEFTCGSCFLVRHRSQMVREKDGVKFCRDCEG